jgi:hypothetical protein
VTPRPTTTGVGVKAVFQAFRDPALHEEAALAACEIATLVSLLDAFLGSSR